MIDVSRLTVFNEWKNPTVAEVAEVMNAIDIENLYEVLGMGERTVRRWKEKSESKPNAQSIIPYGCWCVLIALAYDNVCIFGDPIIPESLSCIPDEFICKATDFRSPPVEVLKLFVGQNSLTGMSRKAIANIFGWNSKHFSAAMGEGKITYINWVLLLLLCGMNVRNIVLKGI